MATRQKRVPRTGTLKDNFIQDNEMMLDDQALDDALDRAENALKSKKNMQIAKAVPNKQVSAYSLTNFQKHAHRKSDNESEDDDDESNEDESYGSEMNDFIAGDEEVEAELMEVQKQKKDKKKKRRPVEHIKQLDDEDVDLIRENVGIEVKKKSRLKKTALLEQNSNELKQEDYMEIDTRTKPKQIMKIESKEESSEVQTKRQKLEIEQIDISSKHINPDRLRQAQVIFGESNEAMKPDTSKPAQVSNLKEVFNADEIDDPFNTEADLKIANTDVPERLQVKLENRFEPSDQEIHEESEWILERLTSMPDVDNKYSKVIHAQATREKVKKVLKMFRNELLDIPMICKYRKYEYASELDEDAVWHIFNLDQEYGKFQRSKLQIQDFLQKLLKLDPKVKSYIDELSFAKSQSQLNNFNALIRYLRHQFSEKLGPETEDLQKRKQPQQRDEIQIARANRIHEFSRLCFLECGQFQENLQYRKLIHQPPEPKDSPATVAAEFASKAYSEETELLQAMCRYAAVELAAQPQIRNMLKKQLKEHAQISCILTEQGKKDLDIFHLSYRVKLVENMPLKQLISSDLFLDIQQCEKTGLLHAKIEMVPVKLSEFRSFMEEFYMDASQRKESWNLFRTLVIKILVDEILLKELIKEVRDEIQHDSETFVINSCKKVYSELIMTGPFQTSLNSENTITDLPDHVNKLKKQEPIIKSKERLCVMGALMHQIDANNYIVTIAVVDKYGDLIAHKDFMRLLPPRIKKQRQMPGQPQNDPIGDRPKTEEEVEHERDKAKLIDILELHSVDLIVVAANSLEARTLKRVMVELGFELKNKKPLDDKKNQSVPKEAFVIWGSTEVGKLFSLSHNSQRLHKGVQQILKQTISLARFEQDPMMEMLNLWSPITAENQTLALNLDPFQKLVNQSRLQDGLEEVNIRVVNRVGVDLNLVIDHEHMHSVIQFLSGLGPRMSKRLLAKSKALGKKLATRGEMLKSQLIPFKIYFSVVPFVLIRIPEEDFAKDQVLKIDILDQTRIHHEHYKLAMKIATDACYRSDGLDDNKEVDKTEQNRKCKEVISRPQNLKNLDLKAYYQQLDMTNQGNMRIAIDHIIEEFRSPFADPRPPRTLTNLSITDEKLFYLLIDESKRTFKRGLIVTATVSNVLESKAICRLENGLNATIIKEKILDPDSQQKLKDILDFGYIITGRIEKILTDEGERKFEVQLNCKKGDLHSHEKYLKDLADSLGIDPKHIRDEDKKNLNFAEDQKPKLQGRFTPRRIAHERFKNISSRRALAELAESEVGEFVFRPSTRSEDAITLTWKFWRKQFVHIDIQELDKPTGAAIGQRLMISNESYENLREIVERYIIPCNRLVREVSISPKWSDCENWEDLEEQLKEEKNSDKGRIPYRFAILNSYQQHVVLAYVPREKVVKEFIKVRPKGFYFHDQNMTPFISLINWFKDQWQTKDYQRFLKRQKSPRTSIKALPQIKEHVDMQINEFGSGNNWQTQGEGSVYSNHAIQSYVKQEQHIKSFGRGIRNPPRIDSPGPMKYEQSGRSPSAWGQQERNEDFPMQESFRQVGERSKNACFKCNQEGHMSRECPNQQNDRPRPKGCFNCHEEGHMARECPQPQKERGERRPPPECFKCHETGHMSRECPNQNNDQDRGANKRQRLDQGSSLRRNADGGYEIQNTGGWGDDN